MTDQEHAAWRARRGEEIALAYDDATSPDGKLHGIIVGTYRAPTHRCHDAVVVDVAGRRWKVAPTQIIAVAQLRAA